MAKKKVFIECGAADGVSQSETIGYNMNEWKGILIEARPGDDGYRGCLKSRPNCTSVNVCLVSDEYVGESIEFRDLGLLGVPAEKRLVHERYEEMAKTGRYKDWAGPGKGYNIIKVPAKTLTAVLEDLGETEIDFFSLDVEGFELEVLKGIDVSKVTIKEISVECHEDVQQGGRQGQWQPEENDACSYKEIEEWMHANGYKLFRKTRHGWPPKYLFKLAGE